MKPNKENSMLLDIKYIRENRKNGTPDCLYVVYKDLDTNAKYLQTVENPKIDIYFEKPEYRNHDYILESQTLDKLEKRTVYYKDIIREIAKEAGPRAQAALANAYETRNFNAIKKLQMYPYVLGSDVDIRAWYRIQWLLKLNNNRVKVIDKGFMDIEADSYGFAGFVDAGQCPINMVTVINARDKISYTFVLREGRCRSGELYEKQQRELAELEDNLDDFKKELNDLFDEKYGHLEYKLYFYDDERKMLVHLFQMINMIKLDIIGFWNMSFDMPYIIDRMNTLGLDPTEIISHPDFKIKECKFHLDKKNFNIKDKNDYLKLTSYTQFICQMELYAAERKGGQELRSTSLNAVSEAELGDKKVDINEEGNIKTIYYTNIRKAIIYNIKDVLLQYGIENKVGDFDTLYIASYENGVAYENVYKQTLSLSSIRYLSYLNQGRITGNNPNILSMSKSMSDSDDEDDDDSYEGALVAHPAYNAYICEELYGRKTNNIIRYSIDMDMSAFYPYTISIMNINPACLIFKVIIPRSTFTTEKKGVMKKIYHEHDELEYAENDDMAKEIFDNFQTGNVLTTGYKWLNLPSAEECLEYLERKMK